MRHVYGLDLVRSAVVMVPAQAAGLLGAWLAARWIRQHGIRFTGTAMMLICAFALLLSTLTSLDMSPLYPMVVLSLYSAAWTATGSSDQRDQGISAARRRRGRRPRHCAGIGKPGAALGVVVMTTVVFTAYQSSLSTNSAEAGQDPEVAALGLRQPAGRHVERRGRFPIAVPSTR
ncbi:MAG: hypothetical protein U0R64_10735 [Candidatus Nanopelagicales bacterium]